MGLLAVLLYGAVVASDAAADGPRSLRTSLDRPAPYRRFALAFDAAGPFFGEYVVSFDAALARHFFVRSDLGVVSADVFGMVSSMTLAVNAMGDGVAGVWGGPSVRATVFPPGRRGNQSSADLVAGGTLGATLSCGDVVLGASGFVGADLLHGTRLVAQVRVSIGYSWLAS